MLTLRGLVTPFREYRKGPFALGIRRRTMIERAECAADCEEFQQIAVAITEA